MTACIQEKNKKKCFQGSDNEDCHEQKCEQKKKKTGAILC